MPASRGEGHVAFEWDENKQRTVLAQHRIDFEDAIRIFNGPVLETLSRHTEETRWVAVGIVDGREIAVVYTIRNGRRRIITARRARTRERREYHAHVIGRGESP